jgi:hypothetical protein
MSISLSTEQVIDLYGKSIFLIPDSNEPKKMPTGAVNPNPTLEIPSVEASLQWFIKPEHRAAFIVSEAEFNQKDIKLYIRNLVEKAGLSKEAIGFGILSPSNDAHLNLSAPVNLLLLFLDSQQGSELIPTNSSLRIFQFDSFEKMKLDKELESSMLQKLINTGSHHDLIAE